MNALENQSSEGISDALAKIMSCIGKLSLISVDYIDRQADFTLCPVQVLELPYFLCTNSHLCRLYKKPCSTPYMPIDFFYSK